jgi:hypothetical protein
VIGNVVLPRSVSPAPLVARVLPVLDMVRPLGCCLHQIQPPAQRRGVVMNPAAKQKGRREAGLFSD